MAEPRNTPPNVASTRARLAGLTSAGADPERIEQARADLRAASLQDHIVKAVAAWPPLSDAKRAELAALLHPGDATS